MCSSYIDLNNFNLPKTVNIHVFLLGCWEYSKVEWINGVEKHPEYFSISLPPFTTSLYLGKYFLSLSLPLYFTMYIVFVSLTHNSSLLFATLTAYQIPKFKHSTPQFVYTVNTTVISRVFRILSYQRIQWRRSSAANIYARIIIVRRKCIRTHIVEIAWKRKDYI